MKSFLNGVFLCYLLNAFLFGSMEYMRTGSLLNGMANGLTYPARLLALTYIPELAGTVNKVRSL